MKKTIYFLVFLAILSVGIATPTLAKAVTPADIYEVARGYGTAELNSLSSGLYVVDGKMEGESYRLMTGMKRKTGVCEEIIFYARWDVDTTMRKINEYNAGVKAGSVYLDENGDMTLKFFVPVTGVDKDFLNKAFDLFRLTLGEVKENLL